MAATTLSKKRRVAREKIPEGSVYSLTDALTLIVNELPKAKFTETVEISVNLGVDSRKSDQVVRGAIVLPHGTGKSARVAVFTQGANVDAAKAAGADIVGMDELAAKVKAGEMDFDVVIASPDAMRVVGQLGQILGPRGLMPNPKVGTVTPDVANAVKNAKAGQVRYRTDKNGIIHCSVGKVNFSPTQLADNVNALIGALKKAKPSSAKGIFIKKVTLSSTMGPGLVIDTASISD